MEQLPVSFIVILSLLVLWFGGGLIVGTFISQKEQEKIDNDNKRKGSGASFDSDTIYNIVMGNNRLHK